MAYCGNLEGAYNVSELNIFHKAFVDMFEVDLHRMAIIHTDLKPDNIIFVDDATVNVYDVDDDGLFFEKVALHESVLVVLLLSALV